MLACTCEVTNAACKSEFFFGGFHEGYKIIRIKKGINLHFVKTDKFKTNYIGFSFHRPLTTKEATVILSLANVLKRGCPQYPDTALLQKRLEQLYGAELNASVKKKGDIQLVCVTFEFANEEYLGSNQSVLKIFAIWQSR